MDQLVRRSLSPVGCLRGGHRVARLWPCVFTLTPFFNLILTLLGLNLGFMARLSNFMILQQPRGRGEELKFSQSQQN